MCEVNCSNLHVSNLEVNFMFDILTCLYLRIFPVHLLASSHPHTLCSCVLVRIIAFLHPLILRFMCPCLHTFILISSGSCVLARILAYSHPHILRFISVSLYTHILASSFPQVHVCLLVSLNPHFLICSGSCVLVSILTTSYSQVYVCFLISSHPQVSVFSIRMNNCILASSSSLVLGNC